MGQRYKIEKAIIHEKRQNNKCKKRRMVEKNIIFVDY
jgi:hypothetical protein